MKVLCPQCERLGDLERYRLEGTTLVVTCLKCGAESRAEPVAQAVGQSTPLPMASSPTPPPVAPTPSAPRPSAARLASAPNASNVVMLRTSNTEAVESAARAAAGDPFEVPKGFCPKCVAPRPADGLSCHQCGLSFTAGDQAELRPSAWMADAWRALLLAWGDEAKHDALRTAALQQEQLVALGRLYRIRLAVMPDDPFAQRGREELLRVASAPVVSRTAEPRQDSSGSTVKLVLVSLLLLFALVAAGMLLMKVASGFGS